MNKQPILCIDLKKKRIRIHKQTLHLLGDPEYIQLLVNPTAKIIAIKKSYAGDYLAHRIHDYQFTDKNSYELYSANLLRTLQRNSMHWNNNCSYRIYGQFNHHEELVSFSMNDTVLVGDTCE